MESNTQYTPEQLAEFEAKKRELLEWLEEQEKEYVTVTMPLKPKPKQREPATLCVIL